MHERGLQARRKRRQRKTTDSAYTFPRYPNLVENLEIDRASAGLGLGHHVYSPARRVCVPGGAQGCLYTGHPRLALRTQSRSEPDVVSTGASTRPSRAGDSSLRSRRAVCSHRLYSAAPRSWRPDQYSRGLSSLAKWVCRAADAHH